MKVLRIHAPGTDARLADSLTAAIESFNRSLDIRLRFLAIEIDEDVLVLESPEQAQERVGDAVVAHGASACVVLGGGVVALAAATAAARARCVVLRVGAGERDADDAETSRALDRIAAIRLAHSPQAAGVLEGEGLTSAVEIVGAPADENVGERIVRVLARVPRTSHTGDG